jgi:hypothetical protein
MGDVEPVEAELGGGGEQAPKMGLRQPVVGQVDALVDVAEALPLRLALVQLRRQGRLDALPDQAGEDRSTGRGHRPSLCGK